MPDQERPTVAVLVPTRLLDRVWKARQTGKRRPSRSQVCEAALHFFCTLVATNTVPATLAPTLGPEAATEVYLSSGALANAADLLGSLDARALARTALLHASNSLDEHGH
jgi:hypothetical protein